MGASDEGCRMRKHRFTSSVYFFYSQKKETNLRTASFNNLSISTMVLSEVLHQDSHYGKMLSYLDNVMVLHPDQVDI